LCTAAILSSKDASGFLSNLDNPNLLARLLATILFRLSFFSTELFLAMPTFLLV
jgi:hypothetical protein